MPAFLCLLILVLLPLLAGCGQALKPGESPGREEKNTPKEERYMSAQQQENVALEARRPPIDLRAPHKLETATFALG